MDIDSYIKQEAGGDSEHDKNYAVQLRRAYNEFKGYPKGKLLNERAAARLRNSIAPFPTHSNTADLMIIYKLLQEKK